MTVKREITIVPKGGMNTEDTAFDIPKERMLLGINCELDINGKPRRVDGFDRFDGQPTPSDFVPSSWTDEDDYIEQLFEGIAERRADIEAVPGEGPVRGVALFDGDTYAWRNNVGETLLDCYKSSSGGWTAVAALSGKAVLTGVQKVRTEIEKFPGRNRSLYIVTGADYCIEWDGTTATDIGTTLTGYPYLVKAHKNHLFLGFPNGSSSNSATGDPTTWSGSGAAEMALPSELTNYARLPGGVLAIFCTGHIELLYGSDSGDWQKTTHSDKSGAVLDTVQVLGDALLLDGGDITWMQRTQVFGNFKGTPISREVSALTEEAMGLCVGSVILSRKAQYRIFLSDGRVLCGTFAGTRCHGFTLMESGIEPFVVTSGKDDEGDEHCFVGAEDGFVYEFDLERGRSFDGESITCTQRMAFCHCDSPGMEKRFHAITVEGSAPEDTTITMVPDYAYSDESEKPESEQYEFTIQGRGSYFDVGDWDDFLWGRPISFRELIPIVGLGHNISVLFSSTSARALSHSIHALSLTFSLRGRRT